MDFDINLHKVAKAVMDAYIGGEEGKAWELKGTILNGVATGVFPTNTKIHMDESNLKGTLEFQGDTFYFTFDAEANITDQEEPPK